MSPGAADAWAEAHVAEPEYPETVGKARPSYIDKLPETCGKCGGMKTSGKMVGKLTLIGKHCGCPKKHAVKGIVEEQPPVKLPVIGKMSDTKQVIRSRKRMKADMQAVEPAGPHGPAPMRGKYEGQHGGEHLVRKLPILREESFEAKTSMQVDVRPSLEGVNYIQSEKNLSAQHCRTCSHGHDSFVVSSHGFLVTGLRCSALRDDPMVAKDAVCDLWTGTELAKGGPYIGPRGGKWADAKHTVPWKEGSGTKKKMSTLERELLINKRSDAKSKIRHLESISRFTSSEIRKKKLAARIAEAQREYDEADAKLSKAITGGGPQDYQKQQSMPDFQYIYHSPEDDDRAKKEREAQEIRRRALADRNKGRHGFHGEPPEPQLRAEPDDYVPATQYGGRRLKDRPPKPRFVPDRMFARMVARARRYLKRQADTKKRME
jgi:hypothetical protein